MINFEKINKMIDLIEESQIMEGLTFNEFAMEFYSEVKLVPLSRYLKTNNRVKRMPKIMNMRKAGELLLFTKTDDETLSFLISCGNRIGLVDRLISSTVLSPLKKAKTFFQLSIGSSFLSNIIVL